MIPILSGREYRNRSSSGAHENSVPHQPYTPPELLSKSCCVVDGLPAEPMLSSKRLLFACHPGDASRHSTVEKATMLELGLNSAKFTIFPTPRSITLIGSVSNEATHRVLISLGSLEKRVKRRN